MTVKKFIALLLALTMLLAVTACAGSGDDDASPNDPGTDGSVNNPGPGSSSTGNENPGEPGGWTDIRDKWDPVDLEGRTLTIVAGDVIEGKNFVISGSHPPDPSIDTPYYFAMWENFRRVEEKYNFKMESISFSHGDLLPQMALAKMAGENLADLFWFNSQFVVPAIANDLIADIPSIAPADADFLTDQLYLLNPGPILGKNVYMSLNRPQFNADIVVVNQDIISRIGAEDPVELYKNGQWTWDKFREIALLATRDTNNSNEINQWGFSGSLNWIANATVASNGARLSDPSTLKVNYNSTPVLEALQFIQDTVLFDRSYRAYEIDGVLQWWDWNFSTTAFDQGNIAMGISRFWMIMDKDYPFRYSVVPFPTGPSNAIDGPTYFIEIGGSDFVMSSTTKDPETVYKIFEEMQYWYDGDVEFAWGKDYDMLSRCVQHMDDAYRIIEASERYAIDLIPFVSDGGIGPVVGPLINEQMTPAQVVVGNEQILQNLLDTALSAVDTDAWLDMQRRLEEARGG